MEQEDKVKTPVNARVKRWATALGKTVATVRWSTLRRRAQGCGRGRCGGGERIAMG